MYTHTYIQSSTDNFTNMQLARGAKSLTDTPNNQIDLLYCTLSAHSQGQSDALASPH
jgi:hypothetical protein